jgi:phthalate 4,5-dioxygenase oxygenase subunit
MKHDQSRMLALTGPGTPMGALFRMYWQPILMASELPAPDCPPVRVKFLSERLLAFRDSDGKFGLIDEFCAHRGVSLWFGRNEACGIRCPYHGWKFDVTGQCVEVPSEPVESGYANKIKLTAYPLVEAGGMLWTCLAKSDERPDFPGFEFLNLPPGHLYVSKRLQECNYAQAMEGGIDSSHVSWLHSMELHTDPLHRSTKGAGYQKDRAPKFEIVESEGGLLIGARRVAEPGMSYWRVTQWIMPSYTMIPPYGDNALNGHAWTPIDDETCWAWTFTWHPTRPLSVDELHAMETGHGIHVEYEPGSFRPVLNKDNDYGMDRAGQKAGTTFSGVHGVAAQDASLQESMGPIVDRERENLVATDNAIIMARQRLLKAAAALAEKGVAPPALAPRCHAVRSASFVAPDDAVFHHAKPDALIARAGVPHTSI